MTVILKIYTILFARPWFYGLNKLLYRCSLRGLGLLNYASDDVSGESSFLDRYLKGKTDVVVLDVGANIGGYCRAVAKACPQSRIWAFEPHPGTYEQLCANVRGLGVKCANVAVGANEGQVELYDYAQGSGSSHASLYRDVIEEAHGSRSFAQKVFMISLSLFLAENRIDRVSLLKIDTEGNEFSVLAGAKKYIEEGRIEAIQFEFNGMNVYSRTFFRDFWMLLSNYEFFRLLPNSMIRIDKYTPLYCEIYAYQNVVAILKSRDNG